MISIILAASDETKRKAKALGFEELTVMVKHESCESNDQNRRRLEFEMFRLGPHQFLVSDFWGAAME